MPDTDRNRLEQIGRPRSYYPLDVALAERCRVHRIVLGSMRWKDHEDLCEWFEIFAETPAAAERPPARSGHECLEEHEDHVVFARRPDVVIACVRVVAGETDARREAERHIAAWLHLVGGGHDA